MDFEGKVKFCFVRRPCLLETLRKICKRQHWKQASLSTGAPLRNMEGGSFYRGIERQMKDCSGKRASLSA